MVIGQNTERTKLLNRLLVLETLLKYGPISRLQIAEITKLTPATISNITGELIEEGLIWEIGTVQDSKPRAGRKLVALDLKGDSVWVIGVHVRMDRIELGLVNLKGMVTDYEQVQYEKNISQSEFLELLTFELKKFMEKHSEKSISAIGIGSVGLIDIEEGKIIYAKHCEWRNVEIVSHIRETYSVPVYLDHNVRAMTLAEKMFGKNKMLSDFMFLYIGRGIGAGLVLNDKIYRGGKTGAGEFGHITYIPDGKPCWCGNYGCLEQYASEQAILSELNLSSMSELFNLADRGNQKVLDKIEEVAKRIGIALTSFANMFYLQKIVLSGSIIRPVFPIVHIVQETIQERALLSSGNKIEVEASSLGNHIGVIGAGSIALLNGIFRI
jgi:N-acetylglucosamine repressor